MPARHRPIRGLAILAMAAALLAGCAQAPAPIRVHHPETGPYAARLLMRRDLKPNDTYGVFLYDGAQQCVDSRRLAVGSMSSAAPGTLIRAERLTTMGVLVMTAEKKTCRQVVSFVPRTGRTYVLGVEKDDERCWTSVTDVTDADKPIAEPTLRRRDGDGVSCRPLAASRLVNVEAAAATASAPSSTAGSKGEARP